MTRNQKKLIEFAIRYPDKWHGFASDRETVGAVCATANLGIIKVNEFSQFKLKSLVTANQLLNSQS